MTRWSTTSRASAAFATAYVLLFVLYGYVGFTSPGFDDEFHTIRWIEELGSGIISGAQARDINPAGSYAVFWLLHSALGSWSLVRLVVSLGAAATATYAIVRTRSTHGDGRGLMAVFLVGLNPALLMWTTSLRWYALFVPILIVLSFPPRPAGWRYWATYFGGLLVLGYLSYAMLVIALPLGYLYWCADTRTAKAKVRQMVPMGLLFALLYSYQLWVFLTEDLAGDATQRFPLLDSVIGFGVGALSNQGVFPLSLGGAVSIIGTVGAFALIGLTSLRQNITRNSFFVPYWMGAILLVVSGLAGKYRNFVVLAPWQGLYLAQAVIAKKWLRAFVVCVALMSTGNVIGVVNVASHTNTPKGSWNLPVDQVTAIIAATSATCDDDIVIVAMDPTLTYTLEAQGYPVVSRVSTRTDRGAATSRPPTCLVSIRTYSGMRENQARRLHSAVTGIGATSKSTQRIGYDSTYEVKRLLEPNYPQYQVEVVTLRNPTDLTPLQEAPAARSPTNTAPRPVAVHRPGRPGALGPPDDGEDPQGDHHPREEHQQHRYEREDLRLVLGWRPAVANHPVEVVHRLISGEPDALARHRRTAQDRPGTTEDDHQRQDGGDGDEDLALRDGPGRGAECTSDRTDHRTTEQEGGQPERRVLEEARLDHLHVQAGLAQHAGVVRPGHRPCLTAGVQVVHLLGEQTQVVLDDEP